MRKCTLLITAFTALLWPMICLGSYRIELVNNTEFITNEFWEEGNRVVFYYNGGLISLDRSMIKSIEDSERPYVEPEESTPDSDEAKETKPEQALADQFALPDDKESVLKEKIRIETEMQIASEALAEAKKAKNEDQQQKEYKKLLLLQNQLSTLRNHVKGIHDNQIPSWWDNPTGEEPATVDVECYQDADCGFGSKCVDGYCV